MLSPDDFPILKVVPFDKLTEKQQLRIMSQAYIERKYVHEWDKPMTIRKVIDVFKGFCPNSDRLFYKSFFIRYPHLTEVPWEYILFNLQEIITAVEGEYQTGNKGYNQHNERALVLYFSLISTQEKQTITLIQDTDYYKYLQQRLTYQGVLSVTDIDENGKIFSIICSKLGKKITISGRRRKDLEEVYGATRNQ